MPVLRIAPRFGAGGADRCASRTRCTQHGAGFVTRGLRTGKGGPYRSRFGTQ